MISPPEISVILRTYNASTTHLQRAIQSVFNQDFQNFELIIVDDGSTCKSVFDSVQPYTDPRNKIIYVYQPNQGECGAANRGILNSSGKYITFIDSDDEYKPNHLSNCIDQIQYADLICSTATIVGETEQDFYVLDRTDLTKLIHIDNTVLFGTLFGKREIFESIKFRTEYGADAVFFQQASKLYTTAKIDLRSYIYYRNIPNSLTNLMKDKHETV